MAAMLNIVELQYIVNKIQYVHLLQRCKHDEWALLKDVFVHNTEEKSISYKSLRLIEKQIKIPWGTKKNPKSVAYTKNKHT
jgi:hypothetical protein